MDIRELKFPIGTTFKTQIICHECKGPLDLEQYVIRGHSPICMDCGYNEWVESEETSQTTEDSFTESEEEVNTNQLLLQILDRYIELEKEFDTYKGDVYWKLETLKNQVTTITDELKHSEINYWNNI